MTLYLIEDFTNSIDPLKEDIIIALTPDACFHLDKLGINYNIIEDFYNEEDFLKEEDAYFSAQLKWFDFFNNKLRSIYSKADSMDLDLASIYFFYLKSMVDPLVLRSKALVSLFNKIKPSRIVYISKQRGEDCFSSDFPLLFRNSESLFSRLIPLFCEKNNINFDRIETKKESLNTQNSNTPSFSNKIKASFASNRFMKNCWNLYKTGSGQGLLAKFKKNQKMNMLFLKTPRYILKIMNDVIKHGHNLYYINNDIIKLNFPFFKSINFRNLDNDNLILNNSSLSTSQNDVTDWINDCCNLDVSSIILTRINYFIYNISPHIISKIEQYKDFYEKYKIDFVITPHEATLNEFAAIQATKLASNTKSICLQHGDSAFELKLWDYSEYWPYDLYLSTNTEMEEYIKNRIKLRHFNIKVNQYTERFDIISKRKKNLGKKTIVYVPIMYQWDNTFWCESRVPDTWYFSWHKELINFFGSMEDINFVWKGIPASNEIYDPIPNLINDRGYKNIKYMTEPFVKWIMKTDLVLLDYPSTALYEAAVSGLPVMSLYYAPFNIVRESAIKLFGRSLQAFCSFSEGIAKIDEFLSSNPVDFKVSIPRSEKSISDILANLKQTKVI